MNVVADASGLLAVLLGEPDADEYMSKLLLARIVWISAINWWEVQVRIGSEFGEAGQKTAMKWMGQLGITIEPVTARQAEIAVGAFERYRGRPARLNMGDCFAYALALAKDAPLLFKGGDFAHTDVQVA